MRQLPDLTNAVIYVVFWKANGQQHILTTTDRTTAIVHYDYVDHEAKCPKCAINPSYALITDVVFEVRQGMQLIGSIETARQSDLPRTKGKGPIIDLSTQPAGMYKGKAS
jgi:hypothetical protein